MREENFRQIIDDENLEISGPSDPEKKTGWIYEANRQIKLLDAFWRKLQPSSSLVFFYFKRPDPHDFRLPDFIVSFESDTFYWEHLGMLAVPSYREAWERKRQWYEDNRYLDRVITSEDGLDGSIDAAAIEQIASKTILMEG